MENVTKKRSIVVEPGETKPNRVRKPAMATRADPCVATTIANLNEIDKELTRCGSVADLPACNPPATYREDKATQVAALLLKRAGGEMSCFRLLDLLYLADRQTLLTKGHPITYDTWVTSDRGPALSTTYGFIRRNTEHGANYWLRHVHTNQESCELILEPGIDSLSMAEESVVNDVFETYRNIDDLELGKVMHDLPEWEEPHGTSKCIPFERVLKVSDFADEDIEGIMDSIGTPESIIHLYEYAR